MATLFSGYLSRKNSLSHQKEICYQKLICLCFSHSIINMTFSNHKSDLMENEVSLLIQAYQKLSYNNNELTKQATQEISLLTSNPAIIFSLFKILEISNDNFIRKQTVISIKLVISTFKDHFASDFIQILNILLNFLSKESSSIIQNIIIDILCLLINEATIPSLFSFIQSSLESQNLEIISICCNILLSMPDITPFIPLCIPIITNLNKIESINLGFKIRPFSPPEFFEQVFQNGIKMALNLSNDRISLSTLITSICNSISFIQEKSIIFTSFLPLLGNPEISSDIQILYASAITEAIENSEISDCNLMYSILLKYFELYSIMEEDHDLFDFMKTFTKNSKFLELFITKLNDFTNTEKNAAAALSALFYCFENSNFIYVNEVGTFLSTAILNPSQLIREKAAISIKSFAHDLQGEIDEIYPLLVDSILNSLINQENMNDSHMNNKIYIKKGNECNIEVIEALTSLFISVGTSADQFFDKAISYFLPKIKNRENLQHVFPSFTALCAASKYKCKENFPQLFEINTSIINSTDNSLYSIKEFAIDGIKNLAILCSDQIKEKIPELVNFLICIINENKDDDIIRKSALTSLGSIVPKHLDVFNFTTIIPCLTELVNLDDACSPLALSTICGILCEYPEISPSFIPSIAPFFHLLVHHNPNSPPKTNNEIEPISAASSDLMPNSDSLLNLLRAMTLFVQIADLNMVCNELKLLDSVINWTMTILNMTEDVFIVSEALSVFIELVGSYQFDYSILFPLFNKYLELDYDDDLFPTLAYLIKLLISKGVSFDNLVPKLIEMSFSDSFETRDFGVSILGQFAESRNGSFINAEFISKLVEISIYNLKYESANAAFVINQMATGSPDLLHKYALHLIHLLSECLTINKNTQKYYEFADNCVTAFAAIVTKIVKSVKPISQFIPQILKNMPAKTATRENFEMMNFLLWLGRETNFQPTELFTSVLIQFFSKEDDEDEIGFISNKRELMTTLKEKLINLLSVIENPEVFCRQVCNNNSILLHYLKMNIGE
ncbi:hypothetical protein TRFO_13302 [Tritrichomonas foetus]|uniref:Importin N-terminal domain-containing protein n=1 Tax=Tritrichomonas foetus TaxID=1144522 RepID=A0A1J4L2W5_9EUKA|nr:hypothetical protein TRFO_13302 [Tritrichomonas foetus]|eukprot:OHT16294.1 hypothetical protein TRFO_13302 [Tritrichomonas foetus]